MDRRAGTRVRAASALLGDPPFVLAAVVVLLSLVVFGADLGDQHTQFLLCWWMLTGTHLGLVLVAGGIARSARDRVARWVWGGIAAAGGLYAVGDLIQLGLLADGPVSLATAFGGPAQSASVLLGTAVPIAAVLRLTPTVGHRPRRPRARLLLDVVIVTIAATVFGAYLTLPTTGSASPAAWLGLLIGPGLFLAVVLGIATIARSSPPPMSRATAVVLVTAAILEAAAQAGSTVLVRADRISWHLGLTAVASALLLVAASVHRTGPRPGTTRRPRTRRSLVGLLPYVALLATFALLVRVLATEVVGIQQWAVVVGAMVSTVLVVWRQVIVIADNNRLVADLDAKVDELNDLLRERDRLAVALRHEATHDPLTGLANRSLLGARLDEALDRLGRRPGRITLMIVDLDEFKRVNDRLGHAAGDGVLRAVAGRLRACVRDGDLVARLGGDEFAVLLEDLSADDGDLARRIAEALVAPIALTEGTVDAAASIGVVATEDPSRSAESLLRAADLAMYATKRDRQALDTARWVLAADPAHSHEPGASAATDGPAAARGSDGSVEDD